MVSRSFAPLLFHPLRKEEIQQKRTVIFVHGYYGSALRDAVSKKLHFFHPLKALLGKVALTLNPEEHHLPHAPELEVHGVLGKIPVIPKLYSIDIYGSFLQRMQTSDQLIPFAYDWRRDLFSNVQDFGRLIEELKDRKVPEICVVAHSMGGLLTAYYLAYGRQNPKEAVLDWHGSQAISKAVFVGTPFQGAAKCLWDFGNGSKLPLYERYLGPELVSGFPGLYYVLPTPEALLLDENRKDVSADVFAKDFFQNRNFPFVNSSLPESVRKKRLQFMKKSLANAKIFSDCLHRDQGSTSPKKLKILNVEGIGRPTLTGLMIANNPPQHEIFSMKKTMAAKELFIDGDDTVPLPSAHLPTMFKNAKIFQTKARHDQMLSDKVVQEKIMDFLN